MTQPEMQLTGSANGWNGADVAGLVRTLRSLGAGLILTAGIFRSFGY